MSKEELEQSIDILQAVADTISEALEDSDFCLHVMPRGLDKPAQFAFISNAKREDIINVLEENLKILKGSETAYFQSLDDSNTH